MLVSWDMKRLVSSLVIMEFVYHSFFYLIFVWNSLGMEYFTRKSEFYQQIYGYLELSKKWLIQQKN